MRFPRAETDRPRGRWDSPLRITQLSGCEVRKKMNQEGEGGGEPPEAAPRHLPGRWNPFLLLPPPQAF